MLKSVSFENRRRRRIALASAAAPAAPAETVTTPAIAPAETVTTLAIAPAETGTMTTLANGGGQVASATDWLATCSDDAVLPGATGLDIAAAVAMRSQTAKATPISESRFKQYVEGLPKGSRKQPGGMRGAITEFSQKLAQLGKPWCDAARFPDDIDYAAPCRGGFCEAVRSQRRLDFQSLILDALSALPKQVCNKPALACRGLAIFEMAVRLDRPGSAPIKHRLFYLLADAKGAHGRFEAEQTYIRCELDACGPGFGDDDYNMGLKICRDSLVVQVGSLRHPLREQYDGAFEFWAETDVAMELVAVCQEEGIEADYEEDPIVKRCRNHNPHPLPIVKFTFSRGRGSGCDPFERSERRQRCRPS